MFSGAETAVEKDPSNGLNAQTGDSDPDQLLAIPPPPARSKKAGESEGGQQDAAWSSNGVSNTPWRSTLNSRRVAVAAGPMGR
jgi:hypothetical protein